MNNFSKTKTAVAAVAASTYALPALAASTSAPTGVSAGFYSLFKDLETITAGDAGAAIIVGSVLIGAGFLAFTGRWTFAISALGVAVFLGYGYPVVSSMAGVTADVSMLAPSSALSAQQVAPFEAAPFEAIPSEL